MIHESAQGQQGEVGVCEWNGKPAVYKKSRHSYDFVIDLEQKMMERLSDCPHFCRFYERKDDNTIIMEKIGDCQSLGDYLSDDKVIPAVKISLIRQTIAALAVAQERHSFTHNDLHTDNIMVRKTNDMTHEYIIEEKPYTVKTFGFEPVIIDFGCSFMPGEPMLGSLLFSSTGHGSFFKPDLIVDLRSFFATSLRDLFFCYDELPRGALRTINDVGSSIIDKLDVNNMGWFDDGTTTDGFHTILKEKLKMDRHDPFNNDHFSYMVDIVQSHIISPPTPTGIDPALAWRHFVDRIGVDDLNELKRRVNEEPVRVLAKAFEDVVYYVGKDIMSILNRLYSKLKITKAVDVLKKIT